MKIERKHAFRSIDLQVSLQMAARSGDDMSRKLSRLPR
jgi:hypothetical protein